jgi:phosphotransferase system HPr-like phosphotransfer protein
LSLGIAKGDVITQTADGEDEEDALAGLASLIDGGCKF